MLSLKLGLRNLQRNRWRSGLTLGGIAVSVAFMIWMLAFMDGWLDEMARGATAIETAQVQVHTVEYADRARVYRSFPLVPGMIERIRAVDGVLAVSPRIELNGLVGHERRSQVARIIGVDPLLERRTTPVADAVVAGRWLDPAPPPYPASREVVVGAGFARQLQVAPGDELVVFLEAADGSLGNDLLRVVGIVDTRNSAVDRMSVFMHLADAQLLGALEGQVHELAIRTDDMAGAPATAAAVAAAIGAATAADTAAARPPAAPADSPDLLVRPWQEILPSVQQMLVIGRQSYWFIYLLLYLVAAVGILNTQRMSALERRREFGVLVAIGMRPRRLVRTLVVEAVVLGLAGALIGALIGTAVSAYHQAAGLDLALLSRSGTDFTFMGVAYSDRMHARLSLTAVFQPVLLMLVVALLAGLWPAFRAARIEPAPTIAGRT